MVEVQWYAVDVKAAWDQLLVVVVRKDLEEGTDQVRVAVVAVPDKNVIV